MALPRKLDIVVAEPDPGVRMRLKQATASLLEFGKIIQSSTLDDVPRRISEEEGCSDIDIVFLSSRFSLEALKEFIAIAKETPQTQSASFIVLIEQSSRSNALMADFTLAGSDAFLSEPYSAEELVKMCRAAETTRKNRAVSRQLGAVKMLLKEASKSLDHVWELHVLKLDLTLASEQFANDCLKIRSIENFSFELYSVALLELFDLVPLPRIPAKALRYSGRSARVKQKLDALVRDRHLRNGQPKTARQRTEGPSQSFAPTPLPQKTKF